MGQCYLEGSLHTPVDMYWEPKRGKQEGTQNASQILEQEVRRHAITMWLWLNLEGLSWETASGLPAEWTLPGLSLDSEGQ